MKDYAAMSDFEINKSVAILVRPEIKAWDCYDISGMACFVANDKTPKRVQFGFSFTSDPADAWPIIVENGITLAFQDGNWWADNLAYWIDGVEWSIGGIIDKNPLRAAMIVFLMMKEGE